MAKQTLPFYKAARAAQIQEDDLREIMAGQKFPNGPQLHRLVKEEGGERADDDLRRAA